MSESSQQPENHPPPLARAADAAGGGIIGIFAVWIASLVGFTLSPAAAAAITTAVIIAAAALGKNGIRGLAIKLWRGANGD